MALTSAVEQVGTARHLVDEQDAVEGDGVTNGIGLPGAAVSLPRPAGIEVQAGVSFGQAGQEPAELDQPALHCLELLPELPPVIVVLEPAGDLLLVPLGGQRPDVGVEDLDGDGREVPTLRPLVLDGLAGQVEQVVEALERGLLVAGPVMQRLRGDPGAQLRVKDPGGLAVLVRGVPTGCCPAPVRSG